MRSALRPCGDESVGFVKDGNQLLCRTLIVLMIAMSVSAWVVLEQPKGSLMERHPKFEEWARMSNIVRQHVRMGNYGAPSQKPTWLYSSNLASCCG